MRAQQITNQDNKLVQDYATRFGYMNNDFYLCSYTCTTSFMRSILNGPATEKKKRGRPSNNMNIGDKTNQKKSVRKIPKKKKPKLTTTSNSTTTLNSQPASSKLLNSI